MSTFLIIIFFKEIIKSFSFFKIFKAILRSYFSSYAHSLKFLSEAGKVFSLEFQFQGAERKFGWANFSKENVSDRTVKGVPGNRKVHPLRRIPDRSYVCSGNQPQEYEETHSNGNSLSLGLCYEISSSGHWVKPSFWVVVAAAAMNCENDVWQWF